MCRQSTLRIRIGLAGLLLALAAGRLLVETRSAAQEPALKKQLEEAQLKRELAERLHDEGKRPEARESLAEHIRLLALAQGDEHVSLVGPLELLANWCNEAEQFAIASKHLERVERILSRKHGPKHWLAVDARLSARHARLQGARTRDQRRQVDRANDLDLQARELFDREKYREALTPSIEALRLCRELLGEEDPLTVRVLVRQAGLHMQLKDYHNAEEQLLLAQRLQKTIQGEQHPDTVHTLAWLTEVYSASGDSRYEELAPRTMRLYALLLGDEEAVPPAPAPAMFEYLCKGLVRRYWEREDFAAALEVRKVQLSAGIALFGEKHWKVADLRWLVRRTEEQLRRTPAQRRAVAELDRLNTLVSQLSNQSKYREALPWSKDLLQRRMDLLGKEHLDTGFGYTWLGFLHMQLGELAQGHEAYSTALSIHRAAVGEEHPETALVLNSLGLLAIQRKKLEEAQKYLEEAERVRRLTLGKKHALYAEAINNLGWLAENRQDEKRAEEFYRRALRISRALPAGQQPGFETPLGNLLRMLEQRAKRYEEREDFAEAKRVRGSIVELLTEVHGAKAWQVTDARWAAARIDRLATLDRAGRQEVSEATLLVATVRKLDQEKKYSEAMPPCRKLVDIQYRRMRDHTDYALALTWLGLLHHRQNEFEKAVEYWQQSFEFYLKALGEDHPTTVQRLQNLSGAIQGRVKELEKQGKFSEAASAQKQYVEVQERRYGITNYRVTDARLRAARFERLAKFGIKERQELADATRLLEQARGLEERKQYREAIPLAIQARDLFVKHLGKDSVDEGRACQRLGSLYGHVLEFGPAEENARREIEILKKRLGNLHPDYAWSNGNLGLLLQHKKDPANALPPLRECVEVLRKVFGDKDTGYLDWLEAVTDVAAELAAVHERGQKFGEARKLRQEALESEQRRFVGHHWRITDARLALADVGRLEALTLPQRQQWIEANTLMDSVRKLRQQNKPREGLEPAGRAAELRKLIFGEKHHSYAESLHWFALMHDLLKENDNAEPIYRQSLAIRAETTGPDHPAFASTASNLAVVLHRQKKYPEAESLHRRALLIRRLALGEEHPDTLFSIAELAMTLTRQQKQDQAEPLFTELTQQRRKLNGPRSAEYAAALHNLGWNYHEANADARAAPLLREVVELRKELFGEKDERYLRSLGLLTTSCERLTDAAQDRGDVQAALVFARESIVHLENRFGRDHVRARDARLVLAGIEQVARLDKGKQRQIVEARQLHKQAGKLLEQEKYSDARKPAEQAVAIRLRELGEKNLDSAESLDLLVSILLKLGHAREARPAIEKAVRTQRLLRGEEHSATQTALFQLAQVYGQLEELDLLEPLVRQFLARARKNAGADPSALRRRLLDLERVCEDRAAWHNKHQELVRAIAYRKEVLSLRTERLGENDWRIGSAKLYLLIEESHARLTPPQQKQLQEAEDRVGKLFQSPANAERTREAEGVLKVYVDLLGKSNPETGVARLLLGHSLYLEGKRAEGMEAIEQANAGLKKSLGEESPLRADGLLLLAWMGQQGKQPVERWGPLLREAFRIFEPMDRENAGSHRQVMEWLERLYSDLIATYEKESANYVAIRTMHQEHLKLLTRLHDAQHWSLTAARHALAAVDRLERLTPEQRGRLRATSELSAKMFQFWKKDQFAQALPLARQVADEFSDLLGKDHRLYGVALYNIGAQFRGLEQWEEARQHYRLATAILAKAEAEQSPTTRSAALEMVEACEEIASRALDRDELEAAVNASKEALEARTRLSGSDDEQTVDARRTLAFIERLRSRPLKERTRLREVSRGNVEITRLFRAGKYAEALTRSRRIVETLEQFQETQLSDYLSALHNLATCTHAVGDAARALPKFRRALSAWEQVHGNSRPRPPRTLERMAGVYLELGDPVRAEALLREAVEIRKPADEEDEATVDYGRGLGLLASVVQSRGATAEANELLPRSSRIIQNARGKDDPDYATTLHQLALLAAAQGQGDRAHSLEEQALGIRKKVFGLDHPHVAESLRQLASLALEKKDFARATTLAREALDITTRQLGLTHPDTTASQYLLGRIHVSAGRMAEAKSLLLQSTQRTRTQLDELATVQSEAQQQRLQAARRPCLDAALAVALQEKGDLEAVYLEMLAWKEALAARKLRWRKASLNGEHSGELARLAALTSELAVLARTIPALDSRDAWQKQLQELLDRRDAIEDALKQSAAAVPVEPPPSLEGLQRSLPANSARIDFFEYDPSPALHAAPGKSNNDRLLLAFLYRPGQPVVAVPLGSAVRIDDACKRWRSGDSGAAAAVRALLWGPLAEYLKGIRLIFYSPDGVTKDVPLWALPGERSGSILAEEHAFGLVVAPSILPPRSLASGEEEKTGTLLLADRTEALTTSSLGALFRRTHPPGTKMLVQGSDTRKAELKQALLASTHIVLRGRTREEASGRQPSLDPVPDLPRGISFGLDLPEDDLLTALEIEGEEKCVANIVVLALAGGADKDAPNAGLRDAFLHSGARVVVSNVGPVKDAEAARFTALFHEKLWVDRLSPVEALRQTQITLQGEHPTLSPTWAGWTVSGSVADLTRAVGGNPPHPETMSSPLPVLLALFALGLGLSSYARLRSAPSVRVVCRRGSDGSQ